VTEAEWLSHKKPSYLLRTLKQGSVRKFQLVACACFRTHNLDQLSEQTRTALDLAEANAGGNARVRVPFLVDESKGHVQDIYFLELTFHTGPMTFEEAKKQAERVCNQSPSEGEAHKLAVLRDIFGNPFRPVAFSPEWRTDTAVSLAQQMYESRDFNAMPILADALQDAGCDNAEFLDHCRSPGPHVRGCFVVDSVLDKR
jgi:hypothetical protein